MIDDLYAWLSVPIDPAPLIIFRVCLALIIGVSTLRHYRYTHALYTLSPVYFYYEGFSWVRPLGVVGTHLILVLQLIASFSLALGLGFPYSAWILCGTYTYIFLICNSQYNNHYYLCALLTFLLAVTKSVPEEDSIARWNITIFHAQFFIVYFYGALNKCHYDWLVRAMPLRPTFLLFKGNTVLHKSFHRYCFNERGRRWMQSFLHHPYTALVFSWGGLLIDAFIIPLLLYPPTRTFALPLFLFFTVFNHWFYRIGYFPYINYAALFLFLDPSWSRRLLDVLGGWL